MAITKEQLLDLGFKLSKRSKSLNNRKFDSLVYPINETDYVFLGYNPFSKKIDFKRLWKSFTDPTTLEKITYPIEHMQNLTYSNVKEFIERSLRADKMRQELLKDAR